LLPCIFLKVGLTLHCFGVKRPHIYSFKFKLNVFLCEWLFKSLTTHLAKVILFDSMWLFKNIITSLTFLNVVLNGLKWNSSNGCKTCDVWDGKVIFSNLNSCVYSIVFKVTWLPCPSKINKCLLVKKFHLDQISWQKLEFLEQKKRSSKIFFALPRMSLESKIWCNHLKVSLL
jgi:hypothetical protein